jgi:hypothetical protein
LCYGLALFPCAVHCSIILALDKAVRTTRVVERALCLNVFVFPVEDGIIVNRHILPIFVGRYVGDEFTPVSCEGSGFVIAPGIIALRCSRTSEAALLLCDRSPRGN